MARSAQAFSARAALRDATAEVHLRMHGLAPFAAIAAGRLTRTGYAQLLRSLFQFHSAIAVAAERSGQSALSSSAKRIELLVADLDHLRVGVPPAIPELRPASADAALGAIYVAEGSMIGGRILASQLPYLLGAGLEGRRFFSGRGPEDSAAWQRLVETIDQRLAHPASLAAATDGAIAAFDLCARCVRRPASDIRPD